ncbi:MAG: DUF1573 domain-containing protein [Bacteroidales bacterium]|nr:DUF1573 domain-containing protein [Bacteroidales bacterium]
MRNTLLIILIGLFIITLVSCGQNKKNADKAKLLSTDVVNNTNSASDDGNNKLMPVIEFKEKEHDFGKIIQGEIVTYGFKFENIGKKDLLIYKVRTSCGCTVTDYPKTPISPGDGGVINVTFDSKGRKGFQRKTATVIANTEPNTTSIKIKSIIITPEY